jgi:hypothetical protein
LKKSRDLREKMPPLAADLDAPSAAPLDRIALPVE